MDGNDPIASWHAIQRAMDYCRNKRRPYLLEALVSRLHGHSSSSGAIRVKNEMDCIPVFERKLLDAHAIDEHELDASTRRRKEEAEAAHRAGVAGAQGPVRADCEKFTYAASPVDKVYPEDYTGLPG